MAEVNTSAGAARLKINVRIKTATIKAVSKGSIGNPQHSQGLTEYALFK